MAHTGAGKVLQVGIEGTYGTETSAYTNQLNFVSEGLEYAVEKVEEESLSAAKVSPGYNIVSKTASGDLSLILKPEDVGFILKHTIGTEPAVPTLDAGTTAVYIHTFTPAATNVSSFSTIIDRGEDKKVYTGCKIDTLSIDAKPKDVIRASLTLKAKDEVSSGTLATTLSAPVLKAFTFDDGYITFDAVEYGLISSIAFKYSNVMEDGEIYFGAGGLAGEPLPKARDIEITFEAEYDATTEALREGSYKTGSKFAIVLNFVSPSLAETGENYQFTLTMPNVELTQASVNVGGRDKMKFSGTGKALQIGATEALTVVLRDLKTTKY